MIIYCEQRNQLCNRLFALLPPLSYALEKKQRMTVLFFPKTFFNYFPQLGDNKNVRFVFLTDTVFPTGFARVVQGMLSLLLKPFSPSGKSFNYRSIPENSSRLLVPRGWRHRHAPSYIREQFKTIQHLFTPAPEVCAAVESAFQQNNPALIIGIHIRRGDYANFKNGKYFFDDALYVSKMQALVEIFEREGKQVTFFISSNEPVAAIFAANFHLIHMEGLQPITDLHALSCCDYILGPPSTFSQWASFMGNKPLQFIHSKDELISLEKFKVVDAIDSFRKNE